MSLVANSEGDEFARSLLHGLVGQSKAIDQTTDNSATAKLQQDPTKESTPVLLNNAKSLQLELLQKMKEERILTDKKHHDIPKENNQSTIQVQVTSERDVFNEKKKSNLKKKTVNRSLERWDSEYFYENRVKRPESACCYLI